MNHGALVLGLVMFATVTASGEVKNALLGNLVVVERTYPALPKEAKKEVVRPEKALGLSSSGIVTRPGLAIIQIEQSFEIKDEDGIRIIGPASVLQASESSFLLQNAVGPRSVMDGKIGDVETTCHSDFRMQENGYSVILRLSQRGDTEVTTPDAENGKFLEACFDKFAADLEKDETTRKVPLLGIKQ